MEKKNDRYQKPVLDELDIVGLGDVCSSGASADTACTTGTSATAPCGPGSFASGGCTATGTLPSG